MLLSHTVLRKFIRHIGTQPLSSWEMRHIFRPPHGSVLILYRLYEHLKIKQTQKCSNSDMWFAHLVMFLASSTSRVTFLTCQDVAQCCPMVVCERTNIVTLTLHWLVFFFFRITNHSLNVNTTKTYTNGTTAHNGATLADWHEICL